MKNGAANLTIYGKTKVKKAVDPQRNAHQDKGFRYYLAGLLGESKRKNIAQMTDNIIGSSYHNVHHFISKSKWSASLINERRLKLMSKCPKGLALKD